MTNSRIAETLAKRRHRWIRTENEQMDDNRSRPVRSDSELTQNRALSENHREALNAERTLTLRLFFVSITFFILSTPSLVFVGVETFVPLSRRTFSDAYHISLFMFAINLTCNFILYCLIGHTFRRAVYALVCCKYTKFRSLQNDLVEVSCDSRDSGGHTVDRKQEKMQFP
ncbi:unnamed protein product [Echinostoma caproni]|uniref:G_PROTEIN_RECEP_F1_2 domain-containing protein n=1 Tax=Echinostoma caproni TaxID=27848 RepID=A0A183B8U8_9TREM|nr:unnamed protein product [Echinostoma caproni]